MILIPARSLKTWRLSVLCLLPVLASSLLAWSSHARADEAPPPEAMLWSCVSVDDGKEWNCSENEDYEESSEATAAQQTPDAADTASADTATGAASQPTAVTQQDASSTTPPATAEQQPQTTTQATTAAAANAGNTQAAPAETADSASSSWSEDLISTTDESSLSLDPDPEAAPQTADRIRNDSFSRTPSAHECQAEGDSWNCVSNPMVASKSAEVAASGYVAAYPDAYTSPVPEEPLATTVSAKTQRAATQGQWNCQSSNDGQGWACQPLTPASSKPAVAAASTAETAANPASNKDPYAYLDWHPLAATDPKTHCSGHYYQPALDSPEARLPSDQQSTLLSANRTRTQNGNFTVLDGNISVRKGDQLMRAQNGQVDHDRQFVELEGQVLYRRPDTLLLGNSATFDQQQNEAWFYDSQFVFHDSHVRGSADSIRHYDRNKTLISEGTFTRCEPGNDSWILAADEITLYHDEGYGLAKHATLRIADVPVFYLPMIHFPIDDRRKSGFLTPSLSYTNDEGLDVATPYYFNIAPHMDDTFTPRYIEERGLLLENEFRYLHTSGYYDLRLAALPNDDKSGEDRWLFNVDHDGSPAARWRSRVNYTSVSDKDYFDDLGTGLDVTKETHLDQLGQLSYSGDGWSASAKAQGYQTLTNAKAPYEKLPQLRFSGREYFGSDIYTFNYQAEYTDFYRDTDRLTGIDTLVGQRFYLDSALTADYRWPWAYVRPRMRLTHTSYNLEDEANGDSATFSRTLPLLSLDTGLYFDRPTVWDDQAYTQTLEPRLYYVYVPEEDQGDLPAFDTGELGFSYSQLFRDNRFSGKDRIGDTHQVTAALTTRYLDDRGAELFNASVGQIFYFKDREVRLNPNSTPLTDTSSDFVAESLWNVSDNLRLSADGQWDNEDFSNQKRNFKLRYQSDIDHQFNIGYRYTKAALGQEPLEQLDVSGIWPINANWSLLARWLEDVENSETLDRIVGLEYENCCWKVRTLYRRWIDDDDGDEEDPVNSGIFLQFTLKGLGTAGTAAAGDSASVNSFLEDIIGFEQREYDD